MTARTFTVKSLSGQQFELTALPDETVSTIKWKASQTLNCDMQQIRLIGNGGVDLNSNPNLLASEIPEAVTVLHIVMRLSCGPACRCRCFFVNDGLVPPATGAVRRLRKECAKLQEDVATGKAPIGDPRLVLANFDVGVVVFRLRSPAHFCSNEPIFLRVGVPNDYPFKPPCDVNVINSDLPHACMGDAVLKPNGRMRRATLLGCDTAVSKMLQKDNWAPNHFLIDIARAFALLLDEPLDDARFAAFYGAAKLRPRYADANAIRTCLASAQPVSHVSHIELLAAVNLSPPDPQRAFMIDTADAPAEAVRYVVSIHQAIWLAQFFGDTFPDLVLLRIIHWLGPTVAADFVLVHKMNLEKKLRRSIVAVKKL